MVSAPILGLLADRMSRWLIVGVAVILWSLASGGSGLAATFEILFATRICVGIGEGGYGPAAPTILSDLFPIETRGRIMAIFCAAIPVGSALGYVIGGLVGTHLSWRWAFYLVTPPGLLLGLLCFWQRDPRVTADNLVQKSARRSVRDYLNLFRTRSYLINCIAMTLMTFVTGGLGFWAPAYLRFRNQSPDVGMTIFGLITVIAGLVSTLLGGVVADKLRSRSRFLLLDLRSRHANRLSVFHCDPLHSVSCGVDDNVPGDLFSVLEHRSIKHGVGQRLAACRARDRVCCEHFCYPRVRRRAGVLAAGLHRRSYQHACGQTRG
jgi:MFS family permease